MRIRIPAGAKVQTISTYVPSNIFRTAKNYGPKVIMKTTSSRCVLQAKLGKFMEKLSGISKSTWA